MTVLKAKCRVCGKAILVATSTDGSRLHEYYEIAETKVLVIVGLESQRILLGPCAKVEPLYPAGSAPAICFAHVKHGCQGILTTMDNVGMLSSTGSGTGTNIGSVNQGSISPASVPIPPSPVPIDVPVNLPGRR